MKYYDGAREKICRLGLSTLYLEIQELILDTEVLLREEKDANGAGELRRIIDEAFSAHQDWMKISSGGVDWQKRIRYNNTIISRIGVEVQVSARSDLVVRDVVHLRNSIDEGQIDVGVILISSDTLQKYLPDRTPSYRDAIKYIEMEFKEAMSYPLVVIAIEHDGPGDVLPKQKRKS